MQRYVLDSSYLSSEPYIVYMGMTMGMQHTNHVIMFHVTYTWYPSTHGVQVHMVSQFTWCPSTHGVLV